MPRRKVLTEIGHCTGERPAGCDQILKGLERGLSRILKENGWARAEIRGLGVFVSLDDCGRYVLQYEQPLARFLVGPPPKRPKAAS